MPPVHGIVALAFLASLLPTPADAQARRGRTTQPRATTQRAAGPCPVEGVWDLVAVTEGGQDRPLAGYRQRKIVSNGHFMWIGADPKRDTIGLRSLADSLRYSRVTGGTGTYMLNGNRYTEQLDIFMIPTMEGQPFHAICRIEADRWYHAFPADSARQTVEVWRRIRY